MNLLNTTHKKDLINSGKSQASFDLLDEILDSQTNDTVFARATERFEGTKDKVDKSFQGFEEKAAYQSKILAKRAAYAKLKLKKTFNGIRAMSSSFQKKIPEVPKPNMTRAAAKKEALLKPLAERKAEMLNAYDQIAESVDNEHENVLNKLKKDVSDEGEIGKNFSHVIANETFHRLRYKHLINKLGKVVKKVQPLFNSTEGEIKLPKKKHSTGPVSIENAVSGLENTLDVLNEIKDSANEASMKTVKKK